MRKLSDRCVEFLELKLQMTMVSILVYHLVLAGGKVEIFRYIRDKVWKCLQGWNQKLLSRVGKEILLKTVAQAMPNFAMNVYLLPLELCRDIEKMMNLFWCSTRGNGSGGINCMRWDRLCRPKAYGGLGFK